jgi:serine/threonine-protein kinase
VIHIAQQICRSLREAHAMGIIHRDLKPANVIVLLQHDDQDFVKVLDFGLSKFFDGEQPGGDITNAGTFMGSPHYIAPEQARNQNPDQRCDIYSLGVMLYQMLTGRVPFTGAAPVDIILKHLHEAPVPPGELRPDLHIPADLQEIVLKCMSKAREGRFQSMDELLVHLKAARARLTGMAIPNSNPGLREASPGGVTHTPPTPQPTLRTAPTGAQVAASTPEKGNGAIARPPPPPPDAMEEDEPAPPRTPQPPAAERVSAPRKRKMSRMMRMVVPPALIVLAGIIAAVIVLRSPIEAPVLPAASAAVVQASDVVPSHPATAVVPASPPTATVSAREPAPAATTLVILTSAPAGAEVRDARNRLLGMTPFQVRIQSGKPLELALRHRGYRPVWLSRKVDGEKMSLHVTMRDAKVRASDAMSAKRSVGYKEDPY